MNITKEQIRAAGGIVHSDGNVFFTNVDQLNSLMRGLAEDAEPVCSPTLTECPRCKNDILKCDGAFAATSPQAVQTEAQEREAFEAWIAKDCGDLKTFGEGSNKHYLNMAVNHEWIGWMKRAGRKG